MVAMAQTGSNLVLYVAFLPLWKKDSGKIKFLKCGFFLMHDLFYFILFFYNEFKRHLLIQF